MKQFTSIEKPDTGILYSLELASSISVLLLAFCFSDVAESFLFDSSGILRASKCCILIITYS